MTLSHFRFAALIQCGVFAAATTGSSAQDSTATQPPSSPEHEATVVLSPVNVSARPIGCFGLSVKARKDGLSARVAEMTVLAVVPNSDADKQGLGPLTQILSIDGREVKEFAASFDKGSDLDAKLIGRTKGDKITLDVLILGARKPKRVTLIEGHGVHEFPNQSDSEVEPLRTVHIGFGH